MVRFFYCMICLILIVGCISSSNKNVDSKAGDQCLWLHRNDDSFNKLLSNQNAKSIIDSFSQQLKIEYRGLKTASEFVVSDSVNFTSLSLKPYILASPRGDEDTYDVIFAFTDSSCTRFYDSSLKSKYIMVHGLRFSVLEKKIICYIHSDRSLTTDIPQIIYRTEN